MFNQTPLSALPGQRGRLEPGPPPFSEIEGGPHHPGAATTPGAGPDPTPDPTTPPPHEDQPRPPGAANVPGAGPNPDGNQ